MKPGETILEMAERHVLEGEAHVERQRRLIARLQLAGHPTDMAETLLAQFEAGLHDHRAHRDRLKEEAEGRR